MKKNNRTQVLYLTQHILEEYWQSNLEPLKKHVHKDILWIGSTDEEYIHGKETMLKRLGENNMEMPPVFLDQQEYGIVQNEGNTCVVVGRYRAFTKKESGILLSEKQRVTFVWVKVKLAGEDKLLIKHLHLSNILHIQGEDEKFPTKAGKENYEYLQRIMAERSRDEVISVKDENLVNRVINYSDIMYIKSDGNYILICLGNQQGNIRVRGKLSTFMECMPTGFLQVSRSYGINRNYVKSLHGVEIIMIDDTKFQIPATAISKVKREISEQNRNK